MTYRLRAFFYLFMMLMVSAVIVGVYFDRPRDSAIDGVAPAATEDTTYVPHATDGAVIDAKPEAVNQA